jgi:sugar phosphate isomerase/epimerase
VATPEEPTLAAAGELGARFVGVISYEADLGRAAELLARLAGRAEAYGLSCLLEFMGFSGIRTLADARTVVDRSGAANAHVLVDALHVARTGTSVDELARLEPRYLPMAQICDAAHGDVEHDPVKARAEAVSARLDPGTGVLPLHDVIRALPAAIPLSVEVPCRSPSLSPSGSRTAAGFTRRRVRCGTSCRTTCCRCCRCSSWNRRRHFTRRRSGTRS